MRIGRTGFGIALAVCLVIIPQDADAQDAQNPAELAKRLGVVSLSKGTSSWTEKRKAIKALPVQTLNQQQRARVDSVVKSLSQFRKLPTIQTNIEPEVYNYFMSQPDVAVSLWRVMGISEFKLWQTSQFSFDADAGDGSQGSASFLYRDNQQCLVAVDGMYKNPVLKNAIQARCLVHLRYQFQQGQPGKPPVVTQQITAFISFPSMAVKTVAKVISPVTNRIMDRNAVEITVFLKVMSDSMQTRPQWVQGMASRMDGVAPSRRSELSDLASRVNTQAKARNLQAYLKNSQANGDPRQRVMQITNPSGGVIRRASRSRVVPSGR